MKVKSATIDSPVPKTSRSPKRSTNLPAKSPDTRRATAKALTTNPIAVALAPNEEAKMGMAGMMRPNPTATKKATEVRAATAGGKPVNGDLICRTRFSPRPRLRLDQFLHVTAFHGGE